MDALNKILSNLKVKYNFYNNLFNLTKQMEDIIALNDQYSLSAILEMRENVMSLVDKLDAENKSIIAKLPVSMKDRIYNILFSKGDSIRVENPLETNLFDTNKQNQILLNKIIVLDQKINKKVNRF